MSYRLIRYTSLAVLAVTMVLATGLYLAGTRVYTVPTDSMQPQLHPGDAVVVRTHNPAVTVGNVVSFRDAARAWLLVSHRVIAVSGNRLTTKGDHNPSADLPIDRAQVVGQVVYVLPKLGAAISWLRTPWGLAMGVYAPALLSTAVIIKPLLATGVHYQIR